RRIPERAPTVNRLAPTRGGAKIKRGEGAADRTGKAARAMGAALVAGETEPDKEKRAEAIARLQRARRPGAGGARAPWALDLRRFQRRSPAPGERRRESADGVRARVERHPGAQYRPRPRGSRAGGAATAPGDVGPDRVRMAGGIPLLPSVSARGAGSK